MITSAEKQAFRRLVRLLSDPSCHFTTATLPVVVSECVQSFALFDDVKPQLTDLVRSIVDSLNAEYAAAGDLHQAITVQFIPHRFFVLLQDLIPEYVQNTDWEEANIDFDDSDCSTIVISPPSSPYREEDWGADSLGRLSPDIF